MKESAWLRFLKSAKTPFGTFDTDTLSLLLELKPTVTSFHFGLPEEEMVDALKNAGCVVLCSATTATEAKILNDAGVDAIIASAPLSRPQYPH